MSNKKNCSFPFFPKNKSLLFTKQTFEKYNHMKKNLKFGNPEICSSNDLQNNLTNFG